MPVAQIEDRRIVARSLDATIPAEIGVVPVAIVLAVRLVMLFVVADEVLQRETVMRGDEVDARPRTATAIAENIGGSDRKSVV